MRDVQAGVNRYYHFDHQGTTQALTDSTGAVTDRFASDAWGVQVKRTGSSINRQWYVGNLGYIRQVDQALDDVRARYLDVLRGRWLSTDHLKTDGRVYLYAMGSPVAFADPSGRVSCPAPPPPHHRPRWWAVIWVGSVRDVPQPLVAQIMQAAKEALAALVNKHYRVRLSGPDASVGELRKANTQPWLVGLLVAGHGGCAAAASRRQNCFVNGGDGFYQVAPPSDKRSRNDWLRLDATSLSVFFSLDIWHCINALDQKDLPMIRGWYGDRIGTGAAKVKTGDPDELGGCLFKDLPKFIKDFGDQLPAAPE
jgi:RHS repeat-associated protein